MKALLGNFTELKSTMAAFYCLSYILVIATTSSFIAAASSHVHAHTQANKNRGCIVAERAALLSFKAGITVDLLNRLGSWKGQDCCEWRGVQCSNSTGHVVKLDLRNAFPLSDGSFWCFPGENKDGMHGKISSSLLALQHLKHLDLSGNNIGGVGVPIPKFLGSLKSLTYLNLACMNFDGVVPPQLGNLSRLQYLNLETSIFLNNAVYSDNISWLSLLRSLRFLSVGGVNLSTAGNWVQVITLLNFLKVLQLSECGLSLPHEPIAHSNKSSLLRLDLSSNRVDTLNPAYWFWHARTIKELDLSRNQITGQLPDAIGNMTSLEILSLGGNYLSGVKSEVFENLCKLRVLELWSNEINQDMAEFMDGFRLFTKGKLEFLDLSATNLTGRIPSSIKHLTNLTSLQLSANRLVGSIPLEIGELTNLWTLCLDNNQLNGSVLEEHFARLVDLMELDLSHNSLHITISSNWVPPFSLTEASFARTKMGPRFPLWLKGQENISYLDISDAGIIDHLPDWFWSAFQNVVFLNISCNQISGRLPMMLGFMPSAEMFDLNSNNLTGRMPLLPKTLLTLDISKNYLSGPLQRDFGAPMLKEIVLFANSINGTIPTYICRLQHLRVLDLSENILEGELPKCFRGADANQKLKTTLDSDRSRLSVLILHHNNLSGKFPELLQYTPQLTLLDLAHNKFDGDLPTWIADKLTNLSFLQLRDNMFSGSIPPQLTQLVHLQFLDLAHNRVSGTIPHALGSLKAMVQYSTKKSDNPLESQYEMDAIVRTDIGTSIKYDDSLPMVMKGQELYYTSAVIYMVGLDLSCNYLVGGIPDEIESLVGLISLNISYNMLTGKIPDNIGNLRALESLDLSFNGLSGEIPWSLSVITTLSHLNLSYNNLYGRIPSGNQLQTLSDPESMYIGNNYLCGPPLSRNCSGTGATEDHIEGNKPNRRDIYLGLVVGFLVGLWIVFVIFLFLKTWRVAYFQLFDKLQESIQMTGQNLHKVV